MLADAIALISATARFSRQAGRIEQPQRSVVAWRVLSTLDHDGAQRVSELAARERISQPTMTGVVNRLAADELLERNADPADGRASLIALSARGRAELELFRQRSAERLRPALEALDAGERRILRQASQLLERLVTAEPAPAEAAAAPTTHHTNETDNHTPA